MGVPIYYVDAFTDHLFSGNPAAVIFSQINDEELMQNIAAENNLSETAFIREDNGIYHIRWFAPLCEIDLCGHATLASAFIFFKYVNPNSSLFTVQSKKNGALHVTKKGDLLVLDFPKDSLSVSQEIKLVENIINIKPNELYEAEAMLAHKKLVYVVNANGKMSASDLARLLSIQSGRSGRRVLFCNTSNGTKKKIQDFHQGKTLMICLEDKKSLSKTKQILPKFHALAPQKSMKIIKNHENPWKLMKFKINP